MGNYCQIKCLIIILKPNQILVTLLWESLAATTFTYSANNSGLKPYPVVYSQK